MLSKESKNKMLEGSIKSGKLSAERKSLREQAYYDNPNKCLRCSDVISYNKKANLYCSRSCAVTVNNQNKSKQNKCLSCSKSIPFRNKYCSHKCQWDYSYSKKINLWKSGEITGGSSSTIATWVRRYLTDKQEGKCEICKISEWLGEPIMLIADHIDGDALNHKENNLRLICSNCDAQLPTYKSKNKKSSRSYRKKYYK